MKTEEQLVIQAFNDHGFKRLVDLSETTYGGREISDPEYLGWEYVKNPDGIAKITVAIDESKLVSQYVVLPRQYSIENEIVKGSLSANTLTHPGFRGRNLFAQLAHETFKRCAEQEIQFTIGFPNPLSAPVIKRKNIFETIGFLPLLFKPLNPVLSFFRYIGGRKNKTGREIEIDIPENYLDEEFRLFDFASDVQEYDDFLKTFNKERGNVTVRSLQFLKWRYVNIPHRKYKLIRLKESGKITAFLVLRARYVYGMRCGVIVDIATLESLSNKDGLVGAIRKIAKHNRLDILFTTVPGKSPEHEILRKAGFYSMLQSLLPQKIPFIVKKHLSSCPESVSDFKKWFLTFGDYDIF